MKQIVDKLNKIAKKINENVELSDRDLIIDSLDSITKAYGGTPNDSTLIVDKLDDIYNNISPAVSGNIEITENTAEGETLNIAPYATATVNVSGGGGLDLATMEVTLNNESETLLMVRILNIQDGYLNIRPDIAGGTSATLIVPITKTVPPIPDGPVFYVASLTGQNMQLTNNNTLNNCTLTTISGGAEIHVTDPTQPATAVIGITSAGIS